MTARAREPAGQDAAGARISVIICAYTHARWGDTLAAVASVRQQSLPPAQIIVVTDHNPALCRDLAATLPGVLVTPSTGQPGLSGARNTGIAMASGDIVAFLDDDAIAEPEWLKYLADGYSAGPVAGVGGLTLPRWDTRRPWWLPGEFDWVLGCSYVGLPDSAGPARVRNLFGGNASFRRSVFAAVGGFVAGIGRSGQALPLGCEETEFCIRLGQHQPGSCLLFDSRAVIWHRVQAARCRFSYFMTRCYAEGVSKAAVTAAVGAADALSAERQHAARALPRGLRRYLADAAGGDITGLGRAFATAAGLAAAASGYAAGTARRAGGRRR